MNHRGVLAVAVPVAIGLLMLLGGAAPAFAGATTPSSTITTAGHSAVMPEFSVTVADSFGTLDGALFRISDGWHIDASSLRPTLVPWTSPGTCGIASLTDGNGQSITGSQAVNCSLRFSTVGFYILRFVTQSASVPSPITVTFTAGFLTAPSIGTVSTWTVGSVNNTDGATPAPLAFNLVDLAVTPDAQYISCEQGVPMQSAALSPSGFTGTVSYDLLDDIPPGIVFDPITGVVAGTPTNAVAPQTVRIQATSSTTAGSATVTVGLNVTDPSTIVPGSTPAPPTSSAAAQAPVLAASGIDGLPLLVGCGLTVLVGAGLVVATRRTLRR